jgi:hypothetical protein
MKRLLVVDLQNPRQTQYMYPEEIKVFMLGRQLRNYPVFLVDDDLKMEQMVFPSAEISDIKNVLMERVK